jgi:hypothetical protein
MILPRTKTYITKISATGINTKFRGINVFKRNLFLAAAFVVFSAPSFAAVTNMTVAGGCPSGEDDPFCDSAGNATEKNVSLILGVAESDVTQIFSGFTVNGFSPPDTENLDAFFEDISGSWTVSDSSITHLAFKANGYYILGTVDGASGDWSTDITMWTPDITTLTCPAGICLGGPRDYTVADFLTAPTAKGKGGGKIAELSNVRAFSVVPIPAAIWLFGSAFAGLGFIKRRKMA